MGEEISGAQTALEIVAGECVVCCYFPDADCLSAFSIEKRLGKPVPKAEAMAYVGVQVAPS